MSLSINPTDIFSEDRYPINSPNPADTVDTIINRLAGIENEIDSEQVNSEVTTLSTGGVFFGTNERPCINIKLRDAKVSELKKLGCVIFPVVFGNLVYIVKYEYMDFAWFSTKEEILQNIKKKLKTIDKWMDYAFIQTLGDYVYMELLREFDPNFETNILAYSRFLTVE